MPEHAIGTNLRHLVGMHDLLQREVAAYIGLSPQGLWNILNGRSEPRSRTVRDCAHAFGVTIDDLFADTGSCVRAAARSYEHAPIRQLAAPEPLANGTEGLSPHPQFALARASRLLHPGRLAQRESARFTRGRSLVRSQHRPYTLRPHHLSGMSGAPPATIQA